MNTGEWGRGMLQRRTSCQDSNRRKKALSTEGTAAVKTVGLAPVGQSVWCYDDDSLKDLDLEWRCSAVCCIWRWDCSIGDPEASEPFWPQLLWVLRIGFKLMNAAEWSELEPPTLGKDRKRSTVGKNTLDWAMILFLDLCTDEFSGVQLPSANN